MIIVRHFFIINNMVSAIEIKNLKVSFLSRSKRVDALTGLNLSVPAGTVFGFLGPNGAGKTTTIHALLNFIKPSSGTVNIFGMDVQKSLSRNRIGYLPEHPDTYRFLTGRELLTVTGRLFGLSGKKLGQRVDKTLEIVEMQSHSSRKVSSY